MSNKTEIRKRTDKENRVLRLKLCGGVLTREQVSCILDCAEQYCIHTLKFSTGQTLQLHDLTPEAYRETEAALSETGIVFHGAGGSPVPNVIAPPLAGVEEGEYLNVYPYAKAVQKYILSVSDRADFPGKLKVSFSGSSENRTHSSFRDLGFAANEDGTFAVYAAGGLGSKPKMGVLIKEKIEPEKVLIYVQAVLAIFMQEGEFGTRPRFRARHLQEKTGADKLRELILQEAERLEAAGSTGEDISGGAAAEAIYPIPMSVTKRGTGQIPENFRIRRQKQEGLYAVYYHPAGGYLTADRFRELYQAILPMEQVEMRLSPDGGLYFINCTAEEAERLFDFTKSDSASCAFQTSIACVGKTRCAIGACDSQKLLTDCLAELSGDMKAMQLLPQIRISGCVSSCSAHQAAPLGFRGILKRSEEGPKQAFSVYYGGCEERGREKLAESDSCIFADRIPAFLRELTGLLKTDEMSFEKWLPHHEDRMQQLVEKYRI